MTNTPAMIQENTVPGESFPYGDDGNFNPKTGKKPAMRYPAKREGRVCAASGQTAALWSRGTASPLQSPRGI